ncbi:Transposon TX1 uncharacterized 149 kDa protein [Stylophora pistillata]|uniref:Transposon TX1 uncharacterized 149 kDa protein n=1 Tax=Stylophora pistillata TaxID=50429 RepID=A0A2B4S320_STYPI|nr:Transposon TX1 uncharacterized 149 kDa protein [Stylophora pistillata]
MDAGMVSIVAPYQSALAALAALDRKTACGAQVRSRVRWVEEGELSTAYFFRLEKKRGVDRRIPALRTSGGSIISSPEDLCLTLNSFYSDLFSAFPTDPLAQTSLLSHLLSSLSLDQARECERPLTVEECFEALKGMGKNKAPGVDGFPAEFYLRFWDVVGRDQVSVLNACLHSGSLALSQRRGIIALAFKKGDRLDPRNWRPTSLLNLDYKIASRAIAGWLLRLIHLVVSKDQTCCVPCRFIGENVALIRDVVHYTTSTGTPAAILSLDKEKAFDHVDWKFMTATLSAMGFGPSFTAWVRLFYYQGCPLSPLLYVLVSEVLAANICANPRISGLSLPGFPPLSPISQYADNTSLILPSDEARKTIFEVYTLFGSASGAKLNPGKSKGFWLGQWVGRTDPPVDLDWSPSKLKILGVFVGHGNLDETKWLPRMDAVDRVLKYWRSHSLSFHCKALVITALALARVWYVASLVHMLVWLGRELSRLVFSFFWSGKRELVARSAVIQSSLFGGFSVVDVRYKVWALLSQWGRRLASSPSDWCTLLSFWCHSSFGVPPPIVLSRPFSFDPKVLPPFYYSLFLAWRSLSWSFSTSKNCLVFGSSCPLVCTPVTDMSTKSCYLYQLSENMVQPHYVNKFSFTFPPLDWSATWRSLTFFDLDRPVIDLNWKIAHGVLYTARRLASFGLSVPFSCFCGAPVESLEHLFFYCPLAHSVLSWLQSLMFCFSPVSCPLGPPRSLRLQL